MDWSRAKNVLLYAFFLLNIILGYQLWQEVHDRMHTDLDWTSLPEGTRRTMEVKHIQVTAKIPLQTPTLGEIMYRFVNRGTEWMPILFPKDSTIIFLEKERIRLLQDDIPHIGKYLYDELSSKPGIFVLYQRLTNSLPIFDVSLQLSVNEHKITRFCQQYIELVAPNHYKEQKILPASQALGSVIEKMMPGAIVFDIQLGYHGQLFDTDTQVAAPAWRIMLDNDEVYYVNAINGAVDNAQVGKKENRK